MNSLSHHGIKGQKRGVRRYQNMDGSLTPAGKQHYGVGVLQLLGSRKDQTPAQGGSSKPNLKIGLAAGSKKITATMNSTGRMNSEGRLTKWRDRRRALSYAKGARERSQALKAYDKTGNASGKEAAESRMSIAGRDLSGAAKASGIARLQNRTAIGKYAKSAAYAAAGVGASVALANPAPLALGAASIKNLWQGNRARKKSNIAKEFAKEHYNDESDYLPENIVDIENKYYRYHPNRRHAKHSDLAHFGIKNMKWGIRNYQNKDGSLTEAGKIRYSHPKADQMKRYGALARKREIYKEARRSGWSKNQVRVNSKIPIYEQQAHEMGKGLTGAQKAAGLARSARLRTILPAIGAYHGVSGVVTAGVIGGMVGAVAGLPLAAATTAPTIAAYSLLGGASINSFVKNHRLSKMYRRYARENINNPSTELPSDLKRYSTVSDAEQKQTRKKYYRMGHDDLAHFGIKNMKWGQRRYQNPDGSLTAEGKIRYRSMTPDGSLRYGSLMPSGKIRPKDPRTKQIKDYGSYRDYADQYHNLSRSRLTNPHQKIEALKSKHHFMKKANEARRGLTAAEEAAGMAEAQRKNKIINAFGSGISGVGGAVMSATGLAGIKAATSAVAIGASSTALAGGLPFIAAGGYMVGQYIRARRAEKMYRKYAKENWNDPNVELPWPLEFYGKYDNKTQKKAYKDYKKDPINLGRQYEPDSINEPEIPKKYYKKYSKRKQNTPMNIPSDRQWQQFNHHQDMLMQQNILNDINRISNETTMMNMHMMDPNIGF